MFKKMTCSFVLISAMYLVNGVALADDSPTLDQVYQAAHAGRMNEAQSMMNIVLKQHPNSAKAHFVEAELLAKQGQMGNADAELKNAEHLKPDLSFAKPQAVQDLKNRIAAANHALQSPTPSYQAAPANSFPWGMILLGIGSIAVIVLIIRAMNSRNPNLFPVNNPSNIQNGYASPMPMQSYGGGMSPIGSTGGGMGSSIMGGLATGAAVGVGMVAGEALAHHFMDGGQSNVGNMTPVADSWGNSPNDMGGSNFGMADNSSWDDNSSFADSSSDVGGGDWS